MSLSARLRRLLFGISERETDFEHRRFHWRDEETRRHLEKVGQAFVYGYNTALTETKIEPLTARLRQIEGGKHGFAFEGAAMALALLDHLTPWKRSRLTRLLQGPGADHVYMVHVGAGWALARLRRPIDRTLNKLDPVLRWLAVDGYGFHEGYFHSQRTIRRQEVSSEVRGYARHAFDQGLGRSLWFVMGADVEKICESINAFPLKRLPDLFSGVGLAATYAGGVSVDDLQLLRVLGERYHRQLAQGAAFAAKARQRAGILTEHTRLACEVLCGQSAEAAAAITDQCLENLPSNEVEPSYEVWRCRIQAKLSTEKVTS